MPVGHNIRVVSRARLLWTEEGYSPEEIVDELLRETEAGGPLNGMDVPTKESGRKLVAHWAKVNKWKPHWKIAREAKAKGENDPFGFTGIKDPIWHLIKIYIRQWRESHNLTERSLPDLLTAIEQEYDPGLQALRRLREDFNRELRPKGRPVHKQGGLA